MDEEAGPSEGHRGSEGGDPPDTAVPDDGEADATIALTVRRAPRRARRRPYLDPPRGEMPVRGGARRALIMSGEALAVGDDPEVRFLNAVAIPPPAAPEGHREVLEHLATAPVLGAGRMPYSSNVVVLLELDAPAPSGRGRLHAIYKPARGERPLWDFPHGTLHFREVATYELDCALGFDLVPPTVLRDGPLGPGSVQLFVDVVDRPVRRSEAERIEPKILEMGVLDVLANNADRKSAHLVVTAAGRLAGIDHGLTFLPYPRQRTVLLDLGGGELPVAAAAAVTAVDGNAATRAALVQRLGRLLTAVEVGAFSRRLAELAADPVFPELDPWDGRPFEWW